MRNYTRLLKSFTCRKLALRYACAAKWRMWIFAGAALGRLRISIMARPTLLTISLSVLTNQTQRCRVTLFLSCVIARVSRIIRYRTEEFATQARGHVFQKRGYGLSGGGKYKYKWSSKMCHYEAAQIQMARHPILRGSWPHVNLLVNATEVVFSLKKKTEENDPNHLWKMFLRF